MAIKSKELAGMLGVSTATMSLVLNHKPGISDELRSTLLERVRELGYGYMIRDLPENVSENPAASRDIAYVILSGYQDELDEAAFFPAVIEGAEREARYQGYHLSMIHMYGEKERHLKDAVSGGQYVGMLVYADFLSPQIRRELEETELPYVMVDCADPDTGTNVVTVNNRQGVLTAVKYLYEKGHRRIGYVGSEKRRATLEERSRCFHYACGELGIEERPEDHITVKGSGQTAQEYLEKVWKDKSLPSAFLVENDMLAIPVYRALKNLGYSIPEDISVIGFEGRSLCSMLEPALTTMRIPRRVLGRALIFLLCAKIDLRNRSLEDVPTRMELNAELVEMQSVRSFTKAPKDGA